MNNLAMTYWSQERWDEAAELQETVLKGTKVVLGEQHPNTLTAMSGMATMYWGRGRWDEAVKLLEIVLEKKKEVLGDQHPDTTEARDILEFILHHRI